MKNYYKILEIESSATQEQIKTQNHLLLHAWHPDKFPNGELKAKAEEKIRDINEAYKTLSDPLKRKQYDELFFTYLESIAQPQKKQPEKHSPQHPKKRCESCGVSSETKYVEFHENIGMIFRRQYRSVKGNFCKSCIDYFFWNFTGRTLLLGWWGTISFIVTPFILINNIFRFIFTLSLKKPLLQLIPKPSPGWVFTTISGFLVISFFTVLILFSFIATSINTSTQPSAKQPTQNTTQKTPSKTPSPTKVQIMYQNIRCIPWTQVSQKDLSTQICIYGKVYNYGPYSTKWNNVQFSPTSDAFRVIDFNYYYSSPLKAGDCIIIFGNIRDYGSYLIITPDKADDSVRLGESSLCN